MNKDFKECLDKKKLVKFPPAKTFVEREIKEAENDLDSAKKSLKAGNYKWATIQAYFSMFHNARCLIYREGYREKSHFCLIAALRALYLDKGLVTYKIIEDIQLSKRMREEADYNADFSERGARALIQSATDFLSSTWNINEKTKD